MFMNRVWLRSLIRYRNYQSNSNSSKRKIEQPVLESNKRTKTMENNMICEMNLDRISDLPEPIIHHIFTFMKCTKDVVRTIILSKKWRKMFNSYMTLDYDEGWFRQPKKLRKHNRSKARESRKKKFQRYVDNSLATRLDHVPRIDKFRLRVNNLDAASTGCIERWLHAVVNKNVKELDFQVSTQTNSCYFLPDEVIMSASIVSIKLSGFLFSDFSNIRMSNLKVLSIKDTVVVNEYVIRKFENTCPLLEDLRFISCRGFFDIVIPSLVNLKRVEVHDCAKVRSIRIGAPKLESFWYHVNNYREEECKIDLKGSGNLKYLSLKDRKMTDTVFRDFISDCPLLEKLELHKCTNLKRLTILSEKLKRLVLIKCLKLKKVDIDAPNLYSFQYSGHVMPFTSVNVLGLREAKFSFGPTMRTNKDIVKYQRLFGEFDGSKGFKLIVYSGQTMKIYEEPREAHLVRNHFCKLELTASLASVSKIVDNWLRDCHGRSLLLISSGCDLVKSMQTLLMDREDNPSCCGMYLNKCWRHYIADVKILRLNATRSKMYYYFKWKSRRESS